MSCLRRGTDQLLAEYDYTVRADGKRTKAVEKIDMNGNGSLDTTTIDWTLSVCVSGRGGKLHWLAKGRPAL